MVTFREADLRLCFRICKKTGLLITTLIFYLKGPSAQDFLTPDAFFATDMTGKCLSKATFGDIPANDVIACFKVMPRSQVYVIGISFAAHYMYLVYDDMPKQPLK